jgi:uncharacterized protein (DUF302 family)
MVKPGPPPAGKENSMTDDGEAEPAGTGRVDGVAHRRSPFPFVETVDRLADAIVAAGATLFAHIDQKAEAERVGLALRATRLLVFGNPAAGTHIMQAVPLAALDLPLKILVWEDDDGTTWMTYTAAAWLADRYQLPNGLMAPLAAVEALTAGIAGDS